MSGEPQPSVPRFRPLGRIAPLQQVLLAVAAPLLWLTAFVVASAVLDETDAIELGLAIAAVSFLVALAVLTLLRAGRRRGERRFDGR